MRARVRVASAIAIPAIPAPDLEGLRPAVGGSGRTECRAMSVSRTGRVRLCGHVQLSPLNFADYPDLRITRGHDLRNSQQALLIACSGLANPSIEKAYLNTIHTAYTTT